MADSIKALHYAETNLGVHKVYEEAQTARNKLKLVLDEIVKARSKKRDLESQLVDREMVLVSEERGKHPDFSATAMEAHMRRVKNDDDDCRELREMIASTASSIDRGEAAKVMAEVDIKIAASRLEELGGYLQYLAAVKNAQANDANDAKEIKET